jgi:hypothetical protein
VDGVIGRADHALNLAVLGGGIWARHTQLHPVGEKEVAGGGVIELPTRVWGEAREGDEQEMFRLHDSLPLIPIVSRGTLTLIRG